MSEPVTGPVANTPVPATGPGENVKSASIGTSGSTGPRVVPSISLASHVSIVKDLETYIKAAETDLKAIHTRALVACVGSGILGFLIGLLF